MLVSQIPALELLRETIWFDLLHRFTETVASMIIANEHGLEVGNCIILVLIIVRNAHLRSKHRIQPGELERQSMRLTYLVRELVSSSIICGRRCGVVVINSNTALKWHVLWIE